MHCVFSLSLLLIDYSHLLPHSVFLLCCWSGATSVGTVWVGGATLPGSPQGRASSGLPGSQPRRTWGPCQPVASDEGSVGGVSLVLQENGCSAEEDCCHLPPQRLNGNWKVRKASGFDAGSRLSPLLDSLSPLSVRRPCCECSQQVQGDSLEKHCLMLGCY